MLPVLLVPSVFQLLQNEQVQPNSQKVPYPPDPLTYSKKMECDDREVGIDAFVPIKFILRAMPENIPTHTCNCKAVKVIPANGLTFFS